MATFRNRDFYEYVFCNQPKEFIDDLLKNRVTKPHEQRDRYQADLEFSTKLIEKINIDKQGKNIGFYTISKTCCLKSFDQLKPITLKEMVVPHIHYNSYLLCRTTSTPLNSIGSIETLVEDTNGDVKEMTLHNFHKSAGDNINSIIPKGTILIVKEPFLTKSGQREAIICSTPSDVIFVDETDELLKESGWMLSLTESFDEIKQKADEMFKNKKYEKAIKYYTRALKVENNPVIHLNRAACYLQLEKYFYANEDAMVAFKADVNNEKSLYRLGKAAYGLRRWQEAIDHFSHLLELFPQNKEANQELEKSRQRLSESQTGHYDIHRLYNEAYVKKERFIDVADYTSPAVKVADICENNKGLVATEDIKKGTLVLVSKAFSMTNKEDQAFDGKFNGCYDLDETMKVPFDKKAFFLNKTIKALVDNPHRADELYALYAGDVGHEHDHHDPSKKLPLFTVDNLCISSICKFNAAKVELLGDRNERTSGIDIHGTKASVGLWIMPSYLNHSCVPNCYRAFYGDVMMVHAIKDIKKDEELNVSYLEIWNDYSSRTKLLKEDYNIDCCMCKLCIMDRNDKFTVERDKMIDEFQKCFPSMMFNLPAAFKKANEVCSKMEKLYKNRTDYKFDMALSFYKIVGSSYLTVGQPEQAIAYFKKAIEIMQENIHYMDICNYFFLARQYKLTNKPKIAKMYANEAFKLTKIKTGVDERLFKMIYSNSLKQQDIYDLI